MAVTETDAERADHLTVDERAARGKAERQELPRSQHAEYAPAADRPDPIELLEEQAAARVPELVPVRYGRMLASPLAFYRGAAYLMASDLSGLPRTRLDAQLCGDAHLSNFGAFAAPDRRLIFSVNDFDETLPGPFEWDLKRLVASFAVAGRTLGFDETTRSTINRRATQAYRETMAAYASLGTLEAWYARIEVDDIARDYLSAASVQSRRFEKGVAKAWKRDSLGALGKLTELRDGTPRIVSRPPLVVPLDELFPEIPDQAHENIRSLLRAYRRTLGHDRRRLVDRYRYADTAHKVVGVGSVGARAWIVLLLGRDDNDPLFLQAKEATASVLERFLTRSEFSNHGQRVVEGQRLMQPASDILLGWIRTTDVAGVEKDYYLRQLWDAKGSIDPVTLLPQGMVAYAALCGATLAKAHARSADAVAIASYAGGGDVLDRALDSFAERYADQNQQDYEALEAAVASGRVEAQTGI